MRILITGGAGFIGSVATNYFIERNIEVNVLDNLVNGSERYLPKKCNFFLGDIRNEIQLEKSAEKCDAIIHLAGLALVAESNEMKAEYFDVNVNGTAKVLEVARKMGISKLIFSSTCSVYGEHHSKSISESDKCFPINPYAESKLLAEKLLMNWCEEVGNQAYVFRFFNVSGAYESREFGLIGERRNVETHLIPNLSKHKFKKVNVFGSDYPTPDGTAVRDYIHVEDLCAAFELALKKVNLDGFQVFNLGNGRGHSVLEIIRIFEEITAELITFEMLPRRLGDPAVLVADIQKANSILGWQAKKSIEETIKSNLYFTRANFT